MKCSEGRSLAEYWSWDPLSTWPAHVVRDPQSWFSNFLCRSLCIIDEFGKGTLSSDGIGLLCAVLHQFSKGTPPPKVIACTHFSELFDEGCLSRYLEPACPCESAWCNTELHLYMCYHIERWLRCSWRKGKLPVLPSSLSEDNYIQSCTDASNWSKGQDLKLQLQVATNHLLHHGGACQVIWQGLWHIRWRCHIPLPTCWRFDSFIKPSMSITCLHDQQ